MRTRLIKPIAFALLVAWLGGCATITDSVIEPNLKDTNVRKYEQGSISRAKYSKRKKDIDVLCIAISELGK